VNRQFWSNQLAEAFRQFFGAHSKRRKRGDLRLNGRIIETLGVKLLVEKPFRTHAVDEFDVSRTQTEGCPVEELQDPFVLS
jgi:hypothetical protein